MNLLIVDDLSSVVKGLENGIDWKKIGISRVFCAYNTQEAREILTHYAIHLMLCDIEMPRENGIQLLQWMREQKMETECIFLTAHADFSYMQEAIRAKGFDYILQPASYEEIRKVVYRAIEKILVKQKNDKVYSYGKVMLSYQENIKSSIFHDIIDGRMKRKHYEEYTKAVSLPKWEQIGYPILLCIEEEKDKTAGQVNKLGLELMQFVIYNIGNELFSGYEQDLLLYSQNNTVFYILIYGSNGYEMDYEGIKRQLSLFVRNLREFFTPCYVAAYCIEGVCTNQLYSAYEKLLKMRDENVILEEGLITYQVDRTIGHNSYDQIPYIERWKEYVLSGYKEVVRSEVAEFLDNLAAKGELNSSMLYYFYIDFTQIIYECILKKGADAHAFIQRTRDKKTYQEATENLPNMLRFIDVILDSIEATDDVEPMEIEKRVKQYVHNHISQEIKRADIAKELHLNVDYLSRLFKKEIGMTIKEYLLCEKMKVAKNLIQSTELPMSFIATKVGYDNFSHFSQSYKKVYGVSPSSERNKK